MKTEHLTSLVVVSPAMAEQGPPALLLAGLEDKRIWTPTAEQHCPHQDALAWHRERVLTQ